MIKSMTGFGRGEYSDGKRVVTCEIKTVNHRYVDFSIRMSKRYGFAEENVKALIKKYVKRGKIDVSIMVENITESDVVVKLNAPIAKQYIENLRMLQEDYGLSGEIDLKLVSSMPDVIKTIPDVDDEEEITATIAKAVEAAAKKLDDMRTIEGTKLVEDLQKRGYYIRELVEKISRRAPLVASEYRDKLEARLKELLGDKIDIPEDRILVEAAVFADKASITEELVRLDSHMEQLRLILSEDGSVGKKLDFLVQEMNREANTIGSKANDLEITSLMLTTKSEIEKIREQVQNIE